MSAKERVVSIVSISVLAAIAIGLIAALLLMKPLSTDPPLKQYELKEDYFNTATLILDYSGGTQSSFDKYCAAAEDTFEKYHRLCDIYNEYEGITNLKTVNDRAGEAVTVSEELFDILEYSKKMYTLTDGALNAAMGAVLEIWHRYRSLAEEDPFDDTDNALPAEAELEAAAEHCDMSKMLLDREKLTVTLTDPEMSLDLGAIAKGYAAERSAEELIRLGADGYVINAGGNIRIIGARPSGEGFTVGIKDPYATHTVIQSLTLSDTSAVTSGGYERYFTVDGKRYHHIINGETLFPAEFHASVTVIHPDSALADCLSTALFNCDKEQGEAIIENIKNAGLGTPEVIYIDNKS